MSRLRHLIAPLMALSAQMQAQDSCTKSLVASFQRMQAEVLAAPDQAVRVELNITSITAEDGRTVKEQVVYASGRGRTVLSGEHFTILQDKNSKVAVLPSDSLIAIYQTNSKDAAPSYNFFNDRLLSALVSNREATCVLRNKDGKSLSAATWRINDLETLPGIDSVMIQMDMDRNAPVAIRVAFSHGQRFRSQRFSYIRYQPGVLDDRLKVEPVAYVLRNGQPQTRFKGFRVKDSRKTPRTNVLP